MTPTDQPSENIHDDDEPDDEGCPACGGTEAILLGSSGEHTWYRCRDCGVDFEEVLVRIPASARLAEKGDE